MDARSIPQKPEQNTFFGLEFNYLCRRVGIFIGRPSGLLQAVLPISAMK